MRRPRPAGYTSVLTLVGLGWRDGRYRFAADGSLDGPRSSVCRPAKRPQPSLFTRALANCACAVAGRSSRAACRRSRMLLPRGGGSAGCSSASTAPAAPARAAQARAARSAGKGTRNGGAAAAASATVAASTSAAASMSAEVSKSGAAPARASADPPPRQRPRRSVCTPAPEP